MTSAGEKGLSLEEDLWRKGYQRIAGVDEAGRGPLAGPLVAGCVIFPFLFRLQGLRDSKVLGVSRREMLFEKILQHALAVGVGVAGERLIEAVGITEANRFAFREAVMQASSVCSPDFLLLDWLCIPEVQIPFLALPRAEDKSISIAAASIVAKVWRDHLMKDWYQPAYPEYGFANHKGYATNAHHSCLERIGISPCHRKNFCRRYEQTGTGNRRRRERSPLGKKKSKDESTGEKLPFTLR